MIPKPELERFLPPKPDEMMNRVGFAGRRVMDGVKSIVTEIPNTFEDVMMFMTRR